MIHHGLQALLQLVGNGAVGWGRGQRVAPSQPGSAKPSGHRGLDGAGAGPSEL